MEKQEKIWNIGCCILIVLAIVAFLKFCNDKPRKRVNHNNREHIDTAQHSVGREHILDTAWNEKIQDTFFGVTFSEYKRPTIKKFEKKGFFQDTLLSSRKEIVLKKKSYNTFAFENHSWEYLIVTFVEGEFSDISFCKEFGCKDEAIKDFEKLKTSIKKKYHLVEICYIEESCYLLMVGCGRNKINIGISYQKYETMKNPLDKDGSEERYVVSLEYWSEEIEEEDNDEDDKRSENEELDLG